MAENCNSTGHCRRVGGDSRELRRAGYIARLADLFAMAEFRAPGHVPPSENENEPIKYCQ
jgi:hypothetical protein